MIESNDTDGKGREILGEIKCFCCGDVVSVRSTKTRKPFFTCSCGTHVFFRQLKSIKCIHKILEHEKNKVNDDQPQNDAPKPKLKKGSWADCL